jgi:very-short-patch-repair endonuclease
MPWMRDGTSPPAARHRARASSLRRRQTEPEKRLSWHLRRLPLASTHFQRQVPLGAYIADFCCLEHRLVIEVDGEQHGFDHNLRRDEERTRVLAAQGFRVLRFSNREVMTSIDEVLDTIFAALARPTPTPGPSPQGGGERRIL